MVRVSVFGLGRVGLVTAACFGKRGIQVLGIDPDREKIQLIRQSKPPFYEPNLADYLREVISRKTLIVAEKEDGSRSDFAYVAVGTPCTKEGAMDLAQIKSAAVAIGQSLRNSGGYQTVVIKSTVTPGVARRLIKPILETESNKTAGIDFNIVTNPEFLREGNAIHDTEFPDRIVMGSERLEAFEALEGFYRDFHGGKLPPIIRTTHENAELIKLANNGFLATKITFINTIAAITERIAHADVRTVAKGIGIDERIGPHFLNAGLGYGGSCFPKDINALTQYSRELNYEPELLRTVSEVNRTQPVKAVEFAKTRLTSVRGKKVAILGLAFKPHTDDMREAVSIPIVTELLQEGAEVTVYDPAANEAAKEIFSDKVEYASDARECIKGADLAIVVTEWEEFGKLTPNDFQAFMRTPIVFDGRRVFDENLMRDARIEFAAIGLGPRSDSGD
jgi:UDPglucose 6-dehydrogenase